jgi:hypothetical protein
VIIFHAEKDNFRSTPAPQMKDAAQPTDHECKTHPSGALHVSAVFKLAGFTGFHAVADIYLDGTMLYHVHGTNPFACGTLRSTAGVHGFQTGRFP